MKQDNIPRVVHFLNSIAADFDAIYLCRLQQKLDQPVLGPIGITSNEIRMGMLRLATWNRD